MPNFATTAAMTLHGLFLATTTKKSSSSYSTILFLVVIVGIGYFLLIRPQRQRARRAQQQNKDINVGDEVMLTSGIFGHVTSMEGDRATVEIAPDIEIEVVTRAIAQRITPADGPPEPDYVSPDPAADEDDRDDYAHPSDEHDHDYSELPAHHDGDASEPVASDTAWPPTAVPPAPDDDSVTVPGGGLDIGEIPGGGLSETGTGYLTSRADSEDEATGSTGGVAGGGLSDSDSTDGDVSDGNGGEQGGDGVAGSGIGREARSRAGRRRSRGGTN